MNQPEPASHDRVLLEQKVVIKLPTVKLLIAKKFVSAVDHNNQISFGGVEVKLSFHRVGKSVRKY